MGGMGRWFYAPCLHVREELVRNLGKDFSRQPCHAQPRARTPRHVVTKWNKLGRHRGAEHLRGSRARKPPELCAVHTSSSGVPSPFLMSQCPSLGTSSRYKDPVPPHILVPPPLCPKVLPHPSVPHFPAQPSSCPKAPPHPRKSQAPVPLCIPEPPISHSPHIPVSLPISPHTPMSHCPPHPGPSWCPSAPLICQHTLLISQCPPHPGTCHIPVPPSNVPMFSHVPGSLPHPQTL